MYIYIYTYILCHICDCYDTYKSYIHIPYMVNILCWCIAIENGWREFIVDLPIEHGDFPYVIWLVVQFHHLEK